MSRSVTHALLRQYSQSARRTFRELVVLATVIALLLPSSQTLALTPQSPEVRALIKSGVEALTEDFSDSRLGALCVAALAIYKSGEKEHPLVYQAIDACVREAGEARDLDMYSHGLAIIFLSEVAGRKQRAVIDRYINVAIQRQKPHGGWGYDTRRETRETGDTSQTQYIALAFWQAHQTGLPVPREASMKMIDWLLATQAPNGAWGYQGNIGSPQNRIAQTQVTDTLTMASLGSLMIGADLFGMLEGGADEQKAAFVQDLPPGVRRESSAGPAVGPKLTPSGIDWATVFKAMQDGDQLLESQHSLKSGRYPIYRLYTLERYMSFKEFRDGVEISEPEWYQKGYEALLNSQKDSGQWSGGCGKDADTGFALLFLLRSTQKSLRARIGEGVMLSGRGLPKNLAKARIEGGKVVAQIDDVEIGGLLSLIEGEDADRLDELADNPTALKVSTLTREDLTRLEQVLRNGSPSARVVAANVLGKVSNLDYVPALLYALTDPDPRVALAARDALRFTSRRPDGFGLPDEFNDDQRYAVHQDWKNWYLSIRPNVRLED